MSRLCSYIWGKKRGLHITTLLVQGIWSVIAHCKPVLLCWTIMQKLWGRGHKQKKLATPCGNSGQKSYDPSEEYVIMGNIDRSCNNFSVVTSNSNGQCRREGKRERESSGAACNPRSSECFWNSPVNYCVPQVGWCRARHFCTVHTLLDVGLYCQKFSEPLRQSFFCSIQIGIVMNSKSYGKFGDSFQFQLTANLFSPLYLLK